MEISPPFFGLDWCLKMIVRKATTLDEVKSAQKIALKYFRSVEDELCNNSLKDVLWFEFPNFSADHIIIATIDDLIVGLVRIVPLTFDFNGCLIRSAGLSSVCLEESVRGKGLSKQLMNEALAILESDGYDTSHLIARRALDHYYTKFGFVGGSSYQKALFIHSATHSTYSPIFIKERINAEVWDGDCSWFNHSYKDLLGRPVRSSGYWKYLMKRVPLFNRRVLDVYEGNNRVAYLIMDQSTIYELGLSKDFVHFESLLIELTKNHGPINFVAHLEHPFIQKLLGCRNADITLSARKCSFGGHMVKFLRLPTQLLGITTEQDLKNTFGIQFAQFSTCFNILPMDEA